MKTNEFTTKLIEQGVYKNSIAHNDFENCPSPVIYITIPYGQKTGGKVKVFKRFSNREVIAAVKFWNENVDKNKVFTF